jgi:hypothetical protein
MRGGIYSYDNSPRSPPPPGEETHKRADVYQLRLVIVALCRLTSTPKSYQHEFQNVTGPAGPGYTQDLNSILKRCLENSPIDRLLTYHLDEAISSSVRLVGGSSLQVLLLGQLSGHYVWWNTGCTTS